jgi:diaminopimelate decarboxylase
MISFFSKHLSHLLILRSHRQQRRSPLRDLRLWGLEASADNRLLVAGLDAADLVERFGSPLLVVNRGQLEKDATEILAAMAAAPPGSKVLYSYKTNCIPGVLAAIHRLGIGAEVISPFELRLAEQLGNKGEDIVFNGVSKPEKSLRRAVRLGVLSINIDHAEEIDRLLALRRHLKKKIMVGVRLGLTADSQFGLDLASGEAMSACRRIAQAAEYFQLTSVHFSVISNARNNRLHRQSLHRALRFILRIKQETGLEPSYLNIGGGYGVPTTKTMSRTEYGLYRLFGALPGPPSPADFQPIAGFLREISEDIRNFCSHHRLQPLKLLVEPGRAITSRGQLLLTRINSIKKRADGRLFALTDAGKISLTYPCDYEYHEMFVANKVAAPLTHNYTVVGRVCTPADWLVRNRLLPKLRPNDILAVMDAGAYFNSYAANFSFPRPAVVMAAAGEATLIRREEEFAHMVAMDDMEAKRPNRSPILRIHEKCNS